MNYYGVFFDNDWKQMLLTNYQYLIPAEWIKYADHCTIVHRTNKNWNTITKYLDNFLGKKVGMEVIGFGISENAVALEVDFKTQNEHSHITLAVKPGHMPVESNMITNWYKYPKSRIITGTVERK